MCDTYIEYEPIGEIHTPFESPDGMPIQPTGAESTVGTVDVEPEYSDGLADLDGFSHCILLYHFHASDEAVSMQVEPFLDDTDRGLFATRAPVRPNSIGLSVVKIESVDDGTVTVRGIDVVDGTPLLDIKPFVADFDVPEDIEQGWLTDCREDVQSRRADNRFL